MSDQALSYDGSRAITLGQAGVRIWAGLDRRPLELPPPDIEVECVALSPDGHTAALGNLDGSTLLIDTQSGQTRKRLVGHDNMVSALAFSRDGRRLVTVSLDRTMRVWEVGDGRLLSVLGRQTWQRYSPGSPTSENEAQ